MRALVLTAFGGPENFKLTELPRPEVSAGTVLVRIAATSVNQVNTEIRAGLPIGPDHPAVLGCDVAGTVEAVGAGVLDFAPGDAVYGCMGGVGHVAVQLARVSGARVATTVASFEAAALARSLGADETINYYDEQAGDYVERLTAGRGFDVGSVPNG